LTLPFRFSIENDIMTWQSDHPKFPLRYFDEEYYRYPCGLLWANNLNNSEYSFVSVSIRPLLMYGLKRVYENHLYFQRCKLCGRLFLTKTANIPNQMWIIYIFSRAKNFCLFARIANVRINSTKEVLYD